MNSKKSNKNAALSKRCFEPHKEQESKKKNDVNIGIHEYNVLDFYFDFAYDLILRSHISLEPVRVL